MTREPRCLDPLELRVVVTSLYVSALVAAILYLLLWFLGAPLSTTLTVAGIHAACMLTSAAILYAFLAETPWAFTTLLYPLAGLGVYKVSERAWGCVDLECRVLALVSLLLPLAAPLAAWLCLVAPPRCAALRAPASSRVKG